MIRKLDSHYYLDSERTTAGAAEWGAEASRVRVAAGHRDRAMRMFKRARCPVPLQRKQKRSAEEW
jgi:hypothetical protein